MKVCVINVLNRKGNGVYNYYDLFELVNDTQPVTRFTYYP